MTRRNAQHKGFSLVELLIAFFVLLVGVLAVLVLFPLGLRESKTMVDSSMAAFVARNARSLMETYPFIYQGTTANRRGWGVAARIQVGSPVNNSVFGPKKNSSGNIVVGTFPVMFPADVLGGNEDSVFPLSQRPPDNNTGTRDRIKDTSNTQFSWDARFTVQGPRSSIGGMTPLTAAPGVNPVTGNPYTPADMDYWFAQYFKYYAVQISVYRNYAPLKTDSGSWFMTGTVWVKASNKPDGSPYDTTDPNRPLYSEIVLSSTPSADLTVLSAVRIRDDKSDWYRVTSVSYLGGQYHIRLDRPYAALSLSNSQTQISAPKNSIIATNSLIESFTTLLGSQLDDIDTSVVTP